MRFIQYMVNAILGMSSFCMLVDVLINAESIAAPRAEKLSYSSGMLVAIYLFTLSVVLIYNAFYWLTKRPEK